MADRLDNYKQLLKSGLITKEEFEFYKARYESGAFRSKATDESRFQYARERQREAAEATKAEMYDELDGTSGPETASSHGTNFDDEFCREEHGGGKFKIPHVNIPHPSAPAGGSSDNGIRIATIILLFVFWPAGLILTLVKKPFTEKGQKMALILAAVMAIGTFGNALTQRNDQGIRPVDEIIHEIEEGTEGIEDLGSLFDDDEDEGDRGGDENTGAQENGNDTQERWYDAETNIYHYGTPTVDVENLDEEMQDAFEQADWVLSSYPYSEEELRDYLEEWDYDATTVEYVLQNCGADWYQEAIWQAENGYGDQQDVDPNLMRYYLEIFDYTDDQIDYAIKYAAIDWAE